MTKSWYKQLKNVLNSSKKIFVVVSNSKIWYLINFDKNHKSLYWAHKSNDNVEYNMKVQ